MGHCELLQFVDVVAVLNGGEVTFVSMVRRGAMVSVATTTANDSIAVLLFP